MCCPVRKSRVQPPRRSRQWTPENKPGSSEPYSLVFTSVLFVAGRTPWEVSNVPNLKSPRWQFLPLKYSSASPPECFLFISWCLNLYRNSDSATAPWTLEYTQIMLLYSFNFFFKFCMLSTLETHLFHKRFSKFNCAALKALPCHTVLSLITEGTMGHDYY